MKRLTVGLTIALLAFVARPALAQDLISRPIQPMEQFRLDSGSGVDAKWGSVQIGPYHGTLLSDPTTPSLTLYCVDFVHGISGGDVVNVNTVNIGNDNADLSTTRLKNDPDLNLVGCRSIRAS